MIRTRRTATALTAAAALALGVVPAAFTTTSILAGGEEPTTLESGTSHSGPIYEDAGILTITTGSTNSIAYDADRDGTAEATQALTEGSGCLLATDSSLLGFEGSYTSRGKTTNGAASFSGGSIGVAEKKSGVSCYEVDATTQEKLTLTVKAKNVFGPLLAKNAHLDVDLKQGANIMATAKRGNTAVATFELQSGSSIDPADAGDSSVQQCQMSADSGPDSAANDNCRWLIDLPEGSYFDSLVLEALAGSFSVEGGADGAPAGASTLDLVTEVDGDLCVGDQIDLGGEGATPQATVTRLGNALSGTPECVLYRFTNGPKYAELLKGVGEDSAQFVFDFVWRVPADTTLGDALTDGLVKRTDVDFDGPGPADEATVMSSCPDLVTTSVDLDGDGTEETDFPVVDDVVNNLAAEDLAPAVAGGATGIPGKQFACIVSQQIDPILGTDDVEVTERIYAFGDIFLRKP